MCRSLVRSVAAALMVTASVVGQAFADGPTASASAPQPTTVQRPTTTPVAARAVNRAPRRGRTNYRYSNNNNTGRTGRRWSYNYSGVGFPRMEGGLTAAANRTTWGRNP
ncbi:MAG TPA: hypothetical protein VHD36_06020 [Pirellulales bacterium]|nr:hypothetical protein [Pirellulales bacterium]